MVLRNVMTTPLTWGAQASVASRMRNRDLLACSFGNRGGGAFGDLLPMQNRELALLALHQGSETFHPVAFVAVQNATNRADLRLVDVTAHHAVDASATRFLGKRDLEVGDIHHRVLHLVLEELRQRPVREAEPGADGVEPAIEMEHEDVETIADECEPLRALDHPVEEVAVHDQQATAVGRRMNDFFAQFDAAERDVAEVAAERVMVARNVDDGSAFAGLAQNPSARLSLWACG